jgi:hypothetical protein
MDTPEIPTPDIVEPTPKPILLRCLWCRKQADIPGLWWYCCEECRIKGEEREYQDFVRENSKLSFGSGGRRHD